mgnify:CR=1 FL=1
MFNYKFLEKSPFDYYRISFGLPKISWGSVKCCDDFDAFMKEGKKYAISFDTGWGIYKDLHFWSIWFNLFGFSLSLARQNGY